MELASTDSPRFLSEQLLRLHRRGRSSEEGDEPVECPGVAFSETQVKVMSGTRGLHRMNEITDLMLRYRECARQVWNNFIRDLPDGWHEFIDIEWEFLAGIVLTRPDELKDWRAELAFRLSLRGPGRA